ncbi:MAG: hypothetical protein U0936_18495 [Planctomycetaceae bacterium]
MSDLSSRRMFDQRPPSAEDSFRQRFHQPDQRMAGRGPQQFNESSTTLELAEAASAVASAPRLTFEEIYSSPENQVFKVVFFPDRIFHAQYLNATRANHRYRYAVSDARSVLDTSVLKAQVFLDGQKLANVVRIEYRASRLVELARESGRFLREETTFW